MTNTLYTQRYGETIGKGTITIQAGRIQVSSAFEKYSIPVNRIKKILLWKYIFWGKLETTLIAVVARKDDARVDYDKKKYIPVDFDGFDSVVDSLIRELHFDKWLLEQHILTANTGTRVLWEKDNVSSAKENLSSVEVLPAFPDDVSSGFEVMEIKKQFIPWGTSLEEILRLSACKYNSRTKQISFQHPVRIGNLVISKTPISYELNGMEMTLSIKDTDSAFLFVKKAVMYLTTDHPQRPESESYFVMDYESVRIRVLHSQGSPYQHCHDFYSDPGEVDLSIEYLGLIQQ